MGRDNWKCPKHTLNIYDWTFLIFFQNKIVTNKYFRFFQMQQLKTSISKFSRLTIAIVGDDRRRCFAHDQLVKRVQQWLKMAKISKLLLFCKTSVEPSFSDVFQVSTIVNDYFQCFLRCNQRKQLFLTISNGCNSRFKQ